MPEALGVLVAAKNALRQPDAFVWLFEADLDGTNCLRVCDSDTSFTYASKTYVPFPIKLGGIEVGENLPRPTLTVASVGGEIGSRLEAGEIMDRGVQIYLASRSDTSFAFDAGRWTVLDAQLGLDTATFSLGPYDLLDAPFPARRQHRTRCDKVYGSVDCGYDITRAGALTTCALSLADCEAHGADEAAAGLAVRHPQRFGGFPGIPKGPARL